MAGPLTPPPLPRGAERLTPDEVLELVSAAQHALHRAEVALRGGHPADWWRAVRELLTELERIRARFATDLHPEK